LLPGIGEHYKENKLENEDKNLMLLLKKSDELEVLNTSSVRDLIDYKWKAYGRSHHLSGCLFHLFYILVLVIYINIVYIKNSGTDEEKLVYTYCLAAGCLYPFCYTIVRIYKQDDYFEYFQNWLEFLFSLASSGNCFA
jgi:hypothetical protein